MKDKLFTEDELVRLGFKKEESTDLCENEPYFYYYTFDHESMETLITQASDNTIEGKFTVEMFNVRTPKPLCRGFVQLYVLEFKK